MPLGTIWLLGVDNRTDNTPDDQIFVNGEIKSLANMDVIKRLDQIIQLDESTR